MQNPVHFIWSFIQILSLELFYSAFLKDFFAILLFVLNFFSTKYRLPLIRNASLPIR